MRLTEASKSRECRRALIGAPIYFKLDPSPWSSPVVFNGLISASLLSGLLHRSAVDVVAGGAVKRGSA